MVSRSVMLLDFDNIFLGLWQVDRDLAVRFGEEPMEWLPLLAGRHLVTDHRRWLVARCYLNPNGWVPAPLPNDSRNRLYFARFRPGLVRAGFEVVDCPVMTSNGKNAADIRLVIDALDLLQAECRYDEFVIASGDSDFAPLLQRLRANDRRIVVMSPGYAAAAYMSLADQTIDLAGIEELIRPAAANLPSEVVAPVSDGDPGFQAFATFVTARYDDASAPLNLASLAQNVARCFPDAREGGWFGAGSFSDAIARIGLNNARLSQHFLWNVDRHQAPASSGSLDHLGMPAAVLTLMRTLDLPRLQRETWPAVFAVLARYAAEQEFNLTESTRWTRDELARQGVSVGRPALGYVVRGTQFGGAPLTGTPSPTHDEIADAFFGNLIDRARLGGIELDEDAEDEIAEWLGLPLRDAEQAS